MSVSTEFARVCVCVCVCVCVLALVLVRVRVCRKTTGKRKKNDRAIFESKESTNEYFKPTTTLYTMHPIAHTARV